jgi:hypothetical protein
LGTEESSGGWQEEEETLAASKANASTLDRQKGVGSEAMNSRESPQLPVSRRKADELSSSGGPP